jgi:hypothetical protein
MEGFFRRVLTMRIDRIFLEAAGSGTEQRDANTRHHEENEILVEGAPTIANEANSRSAICYLSSVIALKGRRHRPEGASAYACSDFPAIIHDADLTGGEKIGDGSNRLLLIFRIRTNCQNQIAERQRPARNFSPFHRDILSSVPARTALGPKIPLA